MNGLVLPLGLAGALALAGAVSSGSSNRRPLTTAALTVRIAALSPAEATRVQRTLEQGLLSGWTRPRERLTPAELAEMVGLAIHQHTFDATEPNRKAQDLARVRVALGSRAMREEDIAWDRIRREARLGQLTLGELVNYRERLEPGVVRRRTEVADLRARVTPNSTRTLTDAQEALRYHEVELALIQAQQGRRRGGRNATGLHLVEGESPLQYPHGLAVQRLALVDPNLTPPGPRDRHFAPTENTITYSTVTGKRFAKPRKEVVPGAGPTVVGFLDYHVLPYTNGAIYLDFYSVRRDHRGQGLGRRLIDEFYLKFADVPWIDWGKVVSGEAEATWERMRKDPGNPKTYGKLW